MSVIGMLQESPRENWILGIRRVTLAMIRKARCEVSKNLVASLILIVATLSSLGQVKESGDRVVVDKMDVPHYPPLARLTGVSAEVTLRLRARKSGDVISVDVVSALADCGFISSGCDANARKRWADRFADAATRAATICRFSCPKCEAPIFEHIVTYDFRYPPLPKGMCTDEAVPPPPPSTVDSSSHVTVRPQAWPCVQP